jgi:hypothetical protein
MTEPVGLSVDARKTLVRRGLQLNAFSIGYNALEAVVSRSSALARTA